MHLESELKSIDAIAERMNRLVKDDGAEPQYDLMSDALYWRDEIVPRAERRPIHVFHCLRYLFRYRTTLIIGSPDRRFEEIWNYARRRFPRWIGFSSERCTKNAALTEIFTALKSESERNSGIKEQ